MSLPKKFEMCTKYDGISRFVLTLDETTQAYVCRNVTSLDDAYDLARTYAPKLVQEYIDSEQWIITKNLDEPAMKFPFYVLHEVYQKEGRTELLWKIMKGGREGYVDIEWDDKRVSKNYLEISRVEKMIKNGVWLVKQVGEKVEEGSLLSNIKLSKGGYICNSGDAFFGGSLELGPLLGNSKTEEKAPQPLKFTMNTFNPYGPPHSYEGYFKGITFHKTGELKLTNATITAPVMASQSPSSTVSNLSIKVDTDAAVESLERLASALEAVNIAMESYTQMAKEMRNV